MPKNLNKKILAQFAYKNPFLQSTKYKTKSHRISSHPIRELLFTWNGLDNQCSVI